MAAHGLVCLAALVGPIVRDPALDVKARVRAAEEEWCHGSASQRSGALRWIKPPAAIRYSRMVVARPPQPALPVASAASFRHVSADIVPNSGALVLGPVSYTADRPPTARRRPR